MRYIKKPGELIARVRARQAVVIRIKRQAHDFEQDEVEARIRHFRNLARAQIADGFRKWCGA